MNKAIFQFVLYFTALMIILIEPDFTLLIGAIWLIVAVLSKIAKKPVVTFKIKKK